MKMRLLKQLSGSELSLDKTRVNQLIKALKGQAYYIPPVMHKVRGRKIIGALGLQMQETGKSTPVKPNVINQPPRVPINPVKPGVIVGKEVIDRTQAIAKQQEAIRQAEKALQRQKENIKY